MQASDPQHYVRSSATAVVGSDDRLAVVALTRPAGLPVVLEDTAVLLWERLDQPATSASLADELVATYQVSLGVAATAVSEFVDQLSAVGLLELIDLETVGR